MLLFDIVSSSLYNVFSVMRRSECAIKCCKLNIPFAVFKKERCKAVSELIGRDLFPRSFAVFQKYLIQMVYLQLFAFIVGKKPPSYACGLIS